MDLSDFAFGTASVGSRIRYAQFSQLADLARQAGIRRFDSAPQYGRGLAQVFLQRYLQERSDFRARVTTKLGRLPVGDTKSLLIVLSQLRPGHAIRLLRNSRRCAADFSRANLISSFQFGLRSLDPKYIDSVFLHSSTKAVLASGAARTILDICGERMRPGVAEPCAEDLEWLEHNDAKRWSIQVTAQDLVRIKALQSFPGTVWINSIIRYSRASGQDLKETMDRLQAVRSQDRVFVVGFNHAHLFDAFAAL